MKRNSGLRVGAHFQNKHLFFLYNTALNRVCSFVKQNEQTIIKY